MSLSKKQKEEIKKFEEAGIEVVAVNGEGKLEYTTKGTENNNDYCDGCEFLRLEPDPDPYDWFCDDEQKAICLKKKAVIAGALGVNEVTGIFKPLYCPKFGRKLSQEEEKEAEIRLHWAQERFNGN